MSRVETVEFCTRLTESLTKKGLEGSASGYLGQFQEGKVSNRVLFEKLCREILETDVVLFVFGEETFDLGALMGFAFCLSKTVILLAEQETEVPFMAGQMRTQSLRVDDLQEVDSYSEKLADLIKDMA